MSAKHQNEVLPRVLLQTIQRLNMETRRHTGDPLWSWKVRECRAIGGSCMSVLGSGSFQVAQESFNRQVGFGGLLGYVKLRTR